MVFGLSGSGAGFESCPPAQWPALARKAEKLGFRSLWLNEEHFQKPDPKVGGRYVLSPLLVAAAMASRTSRIRLGFSVLLLPLHQPVRLAEELASLDCLSRGRVDFGVSRGGSPRYFDAFGVDRSAGRADFPEALQRIIDCWGDRPITVGGSQIDVEPKPIQFPHPPIYVGTYSEELCAWAARAGHRIIIHGIQSAAHALDTLRRFVDAGGDPSVVPFGRFVYVSDTDETARRELMPVLANLCERLRGVGSSRPGLFEGVSLEPEAFFDTMVIAGSARTCIGRIQQLRDTLGIRHLNLLSAFFGYLPPPLLRLSLQRFSSQVMPAFQ
jgi:alkanesulfonate monooxygenase SsuD/methylene tetrahydromethanopterin reductase-like flavin-dependent oxidoreductase (luciferase family)